jgi:hypothetical protein
MSGCGDLCTAQQCRILEQKIDQLWVYIHGLEDRLGALEQAHELLEAAFEGHIQQDIPQAHNYQPQVDVALAITGLNSGENSLKVFVKVDDQSDSETIILPKYEPEVDVSLAANNEDNSLKVFVAVGDKNDSETITLPIPEEPEVTVGVFDFGNNEFGISVQVGSKQAQDDFKITLSEQHVKSNLKLDGSFQSDTLTLTVADGESQDTATISIPLPEIPEAEKHVKSNLRLNGSFQSEVLTLTVADGESQDTATITITLPDMNCDNLEQEVKDCCEQLTNLISGRFNNLDNQLANLENAINTEIKQVYDEITIDISGTANTNYSCGFPTDEDTLKMIPTYAVSTSEPVNYTGKGLKGIQENLKLINSNLDRLHSDVCKAVDPISSITVDDLYRYCELGFDIDKSLYFNEDGTPKYSNAQEDFNQATKDYALQLISETKYGYLLESISENILITAPNNWITPIIADFSLIQGRINNVQICQIKENELELPDVVSIVASPKYVTNVDDKVLILHFVTLDNYPKRSRGSNYRQIQIPGAKETYNWDNDFLNLTWLQGNQYAELELNEYRAKVSGWFASKGAADTFFDKVLNLTIGTEKNRRYPEQKYSRTDIAIADTRPYRAFIESINESGQAICHVKYVPPKPEDA